MFVCCMRTGIEITVSPASRQRLEAIAAGRSTPQKHVWRARIILLTGDWHGTAAIMRATGKSKTCIWRWQERFMREGVEGLLRDKTRPPGIAPLDPKTVDKIVALTLARPPHEATHWTVRAMAKKAKAASQPYKKSGAIMGLLLIAGGPSSSQKTPPLLKNCTISWGFTCRRPCGGAFHR
jgi:hypothetical protein